MWLMNDLSLAALEPGCVKLTALSPQPNLTWAFIQFFILTTQAVCEQKHECMCSVSLDHNRNSPKFHMRKMRSWPEQKAPEAWDPTTCFGPWELHWDPFSGLCISSATSCCTHWLLGTMS